MIRNLLKISFNIPLTFLLSYTENTQQKNFEELYANCSECQANVSMNEISFKILHNHFLYKFQ